MHSSVTFIHPEFYPKKILMRLNGLINRGLKNAKSIICVSKNVRDLTAEKFKIPLERLPVVYNGISENFKEIDEKQVKSTVKEKFNIDYPYILYTGKLQANKNIIRIIEAFNIFKNETKNNIKLVLAGKKIWTAEGIDETIDKLNIRGDIIELGHVDSSNLPVLYNGAKMLAFPSLWEGFGIPLIESMACGTPVITSNNSSLPEIAGGAAVLVDPYVTEDIAEGMYNLYTDASLYADLKEKGLNRSKLFSWEETARQTLKIYNSCLDF